MFLEKPGELQKQVVMRPSAPLLPELSAESALCPNKEGLSGHTKTIREDGEPAPFNWLHSGHFVLEDAFGSSVRSRRMDSLKFDRGFF